VKRSAGFTKPELVLLFTRVPVAVTAQRDVLQVVRAVAKHLARQVCHVAVNCQEKTFVENLFNMYFFDTADVINEWLGTLSGFEFDSK